MTGSVMLQTINGIDLLIVILGLVVAFFAYRQGERIGFWVGYERGFEDGRYDGVDTALSVVEEAQAVVVSIRARRGGAPYDWAVDGL